MKKYSILTAEVDKNNEDEFRFAAIKNDDDSVVYNFESCSFKEINDTTEFVANLILLEQQNGELVHLDKNDIRIPTLTEESNEILKQFVDDLYLKMNTEVEYIMADE